MILCYSKVLSQIAITHFALRKLRNLFSAAEVQLFFDICKHFQRKKQIISLFQYVNVRFAEKSAAIGSNADNFKNGNFKTKIV